MHRLCVWPSTKWDDTWGWGNEDRRTRRWGGHGEGHWGLRHICVLCPRYIFFPWFFFLLMIIYRYTTCMIMTPTPTPLSPSLLLCVRLLQGWMATYHSRRTWGQALGLETYMSWAPSVFIYRLYMYDNATPTLLPSFRQFFFIRKFISIVINTIYSCYYVFQFGVMVGCDWPYDSILTVEGSWVWAMCLSFIFFAHLYFTIYGLSASICKSTRSIDSTPLLQRLLAVPDLQGLQGLHVCCRDYTLIAIILKKNSPELHVLQPK